MSPSIFSTLRQTWRGLYARGMELLTADEITRLSWARRLNSYATVPEIYRPYLNAHLPSPQAFPGGILTPTFRGFLRQENERLVLLHEGCVHILEHQSNGIAVTIMPLAEIDLIERGAVLLRAWVTLMGQDIKGRQRQVTLRYNSVTEHLFHPLVDAFRRLSAPVTVAPWGYSAQTLAAIDALEPISFKFRNYARRSLLAGDQIQVSIYQPEIQNPRLRPFAHGWLRRRLCSTHLCLLTHSELILICDDPDALQDCDQHPYGGVWTYLPRRRITAAGLESAESGSLRLHISLCGGNQVNTLFDASHKAQLEKVVSEISRPLHPFIG